MANTVFGSGLSREVPPRFGEGILGAASGGSESGIMLATRLVAVTALLCCLGGHSQASRTDQAIVRADSVQVKSIRYLGYRFMVPKAWPVIDTISNPRDCVRFDQHAVYLGSVSGNEFCPSWLLGTTESVLIQPGSARSAVSSAEDPVAREITVTAARVQIT